MDEAEPQRHRPTAGHHQGTGHVYAIDHFVEPWEVRCQALVEMLEAHKIVSSEEIQQGVECLGPEIIHHLTSCERRIVSFTNILFQKAIFTPDELASQMDKITLRNIADRSPR